MLRHTCTIAFFVLLFTMTVVAGSQAQTLEVVPNAVTLNARVRVMAASLLQEGRVMERGESLELSAGDSSVRIQLIDIDSLWVRRTATATGAAVGLIIGLLPIVLMCRDSIDECGVVPNGLLIIGASTGVGAAIGASIVRWRLVFGRAAFR